VTAVTKLLTILFKDYIAYITVPRIDNTSKAVALMRDQIPNLDSGRGVLRF
jgi:hypothetical protein